MRILHVLEAVEGGVALHVRTLTTAQCALGHEVAVAGPEKRSTGLTDTAFWDVVGSAGATSSVFPFHHLPLHPRNLPAVRKLRDVIRTWRPDVVHTHSTAAGALGRPLARRLKLPTVHTPNGVRFADARRTLVGAGERILERVLAPVTTYVVAVSRSEADVLEPVYTARRVVVVPNGLEVLDEPADPFPERARVVSVGRLRYQKAPEQTVRILAALRRRRPDVEAVIVGDGGMAGRIRALRDEVDPGITLALGELGGREAIRSSTVVLLTSRWEGAPYVALEAMERSRAVVASDVVGSRDVVVHGSTGYLFPFGDVPSAVASLLSVLDDRNRAADMGAAGRARLIENYTIGRMVDGIAAVYERALRDGGR